MVLISVVMIFWLVNVDVVWFTLIGNRFCDMFVCKICCLEELAANLWMTALCLFEVVTCNYFENVEVLDYWWPKDHSSTAIHTDNVGSYMI